MKTIPIQLLESYKKPGRSTCFLVRIKDDEDNVYGFTNLDARVRLDDGDGMVTYSPRQELNPQNILNTSDMDVDSTELHGWFDDLMEKAVLAGKFANAEVTVYRTSYLRQSAGVEVVAFGTAGKIDFSADRGGKRKLEWRGFTDVLRSKRNDQYSLTCRNRFGDDKCGMPFVWESATITSVQDNRSRFTVAGLSRPDNYYTFGLVEFNGGPNDGATLEIEEWHADGRIVLSFVTPYVIDNGLSIRVRRDCDKRAQTCIDYGNIVNMNAEHLTPTENQSLMVPGAYIKSANAL